MSKRTTPELQALAKAAYETSKSIIGNNPPEHELVPVFLALQPDGRIEIIGTPFYGDDSKDNIAAMLRKKFSEDNTAAYIHCAEAWCVTHSKSEGPVTVRPSKSERRKEVVIIAGQDRKGNIVHIMAEIMRDANNKRTLGPINEGLSDVDSLGGRFANLLGEAVDIDLP